jgi:hypothetical protein
LLTTIENFRNFQSTVPTVHDGETGRGVGMALVREDTILVSGSDQEEPNPIGSAYPYLDLFYRISNLDKIFILYKAQ